jgi:hypothetical protein
MARAADRYQLSSMRSFVIQKCALPDFADFDSCTQSKIDYYLQRLLLNTLNLRKWHQVGRRKG